MDFTKDELNYIYNCLQVCHIEFDDMEDMADMEQSKANAELFEVISAKIVKELEQGETIVAYADLTEDEKIMAYQNYISARSVEEETEEEETRKYHSMDELISCHGFVRVNGAIEVII